MRPSTRGRSMVRASASGSCAAPDGSMASTTVTAVRTKRVEYSRSCNTTPIEGGAPRARARGIRAEKTPDHGGNAKRVRERVESPARRPLKRIGDRLPANRPDRNADGAADQAEHHRLDQELPQDVP